MKQTRVFLIFYSIVFSQLIACSSVTTEDSSSSEKGIYHVANHGVAIVTNTDTILIDALFEKIYPNFTAPSPQTITALMDAQGIFNKPLLSLVTHKHFDHYSQAFSLALLHKRDDFKQWVPTSINQFLDIPAIQKVDCASSVKIHSTKEFSIYCSELSHTQVPLEKMKHNAYLLELDNALILHAGDADIDSLSQINFPEYNLSQVTHAILPMWFFDKQDVYLQVELLFPNAKLIISHLQTNEVDTLTEMYQQNSNVILLHENNSTINL